MGKVHNRFKEFLTKAKSSIRGLVLICQIKLCKVATFCWLLETVRSCCRKLISWQCFSTFPNVFLENRVSQTEIFKQVQKAYDGPRRIQGWDKILHGPATYSKALSFSVDLQIKIAKTAGIWLMRKKRWTIYGCDKSSHVSEYCNTFFRAGRT